MSKQKSDKKKKTKKLPKPIEPKTHIAPLRAVRRADHPPWVTVYSGGCPVFTTSYSRFLELFGIPIPENGAVRLTNHRKSLTDIALGSPRPAIQPIGWAVYDNDGVIVFTRSRAVAEDVADDHDRLVDDGSKRDIYPLWIGQPIPRSDPHPHKRKKQ